MTKGRSSSSTLIEKLNQPISWKAFLDVMTHELKVGGKSGVRDFADLDIEVERLLEQAELSAQRRGVTVEQVLAEMGLVSGSAIDDEGNLDREQLLHDLGWEDVDASIHQQDSRAKGQKRRPARRGMLDEASTLREIQTLLPQLTMDDISVFLERLSLHNGKFVDKLLFCDVMDELQLQEVRDAAETHEDAPLWRLILIAGGDLEALVRVMETEPWFPLLEKHEGDFAEYLLEQGLISYRQFKEHSQHRLVDTSSTLVQLQDLLGDDVDIHTLVAGFFGLPVMAPEEFTPFPGNIPSPLVGFFRIFDVVPLEMEPEQFVLGVLRPPSELIIEATRQFSAPTVFRIVSQDDYNEFRNGIQGQLNVSRNLAGKRMQAKEFLDLRERLANISAVRLVEELFAKALDVEATDIHMEHQEAGFRIRFRVDSILKDAMYIHPGLADEVTSRIKILADMDITERRQPQDGHIKATIRGQEINMRVAVVPTYHGERIGIRLVNSGKIQLSLEQLGLDAQDLARLERLASRPYGMILTTGPVGSGKTTTLYSSLARLNAEELNIITIEDPVEYELEGINQIEVNYRIDFGFVEGLRAVLRQDPNVILLGEIRDHETAAIAIRASMTGLLVFSSLHTNDAVGAVTTFHNFQVPPLLIANSLLGVVAQRLVRRLCSECKQTSSATPEEVKLFSERGISLNESSELCRPVGCEACYYSGYKGRVGLFEILEITSEMRDLILEGAPESQLRDLAIANGMRLLSHDALRKVKQHMTSLEEVKRVVFL